LALCREQKKNEETTREEATLKRGGGIRRLRGVVPGGFGGTDICQGQQTHFQISFNTKENAKITHNDTRKQARNSANANTYMSRLTNI